MKRPHSTVDVITTATPVCPSLDYKQEPAVLANWYAAYPGNIYPGYDERAIAAYMKYYNFSYLNRPWLYLTRIGPGAPCGEIRLPAGNPPPPDQAGWYTSGDPTLAVNPYNHGRRLTDGGVKPGRMYVAGTTYNPNYTQISVWHSDDGGLTGWDTLPSVLGNNGAPIQTSDWVLDKPSISVSYDAGSTSPYRPSTLGWVYVVAAYSPWVSSTGATTLYVYRSTDGDTFTRTAAAITGDGYVSTLQATSPQIMIDYATGKVYVFWIDAADQKIHGVVSSDQGNSFQPLPQPSTVATGPLLVAGDDNIVAAGVSLEARSQLAAHFSWLSRKVCLAWHAREGASPGPTNVHLATYDVDANIWSTSTLMVNNSQWNPALDADSNGDIIMSYYDRREDQWDVLYNVTISKFTANAAWYSQGATRYGGDVPVSPNLSDPRISPPSAGTYQLGEYQGLWTSSGRLWSGFMFSTAPRELDVNYAYMQTP